jgi:hypothetical protein
MHYDDPSRRMNLLSGLVFGAILGAGLVLLLTPDDQALSRVPRARTPRRLRSGRATVTKSAAKERPPRPAETASSRARRRFEL